MPTDHPPTEKPRISEWGYSEISEKSHSLAFAAPNADLTPLPSGNTAPADRTGREAEDPVGVISDALAER